MIRPRIKLKKRRATEDQIINEIHSLLHGNGSRPYSLSVTETAKILKVSRDTIYRYIKKMKGTQQILKDKNGKLHLPEIPQDAKFREFNKSHEITNELLVTEWIDDLLTRKLGAPLKVWKMRVSSLKAICNTCKVIPQDLIVSQRKTEKIMRDFARIYQSGNAVQSSRGIKSSGLGTGIYTRVQAVRDFCAFYNIFWPRGVNGVMSQKVPGHGKYGDIRLTEKELQDADNFIKEKWGLDSDVYRWFWVGVESCARYEALYNMPLEYTTSISKSGNTTYIMVAKESKTEHIRGGKWFKYITRDDTQKSLDLIKNRGGQRIHELEISRYQFAKKMHSSLRLVYKHIGKQADYFQKHPTHALRHIGAHYWLAKTGYNFGLIAEIGGWNTMDELKKSYGQIPPEKILEMIGRHD